MSATYGRREENFVAEDADYRNAAVQLTTFSRRMVDAHCVRDGGSFTLRWLVAFHPVRVVRVFRVHQV